MLRPYILHPYHHPGSNRRALPRASGFLAKSALLFHSCRYIETMFYSLKENMLIWTGITETKNPKNAAKVVGEIAKETTKYLQKEGLIAKKKK